ncbi:hypothetical protein P1744_000615 [Neisseria gonorrhoeae]
MDNSGSEATGKYQGNITFSADNPFGLSDMFYVNYGRSIGGTPDEENFDGHRKADQTITPYIIQPLSVNGHGHSITMATVTIRRFSDYRKSMTIMEKVTTLISASTACCIVMPNAKPISV